MIFFSKEIIQRTGRKRSRLDLQASDVDHKVIRGKVVKDVSFCFIAESQEAGEGHGQAGDHGDKGRVVSYFSKAVYGRYLQGAVD